MPYQIVRLDNLNLRLQLGTFENQLEKLQTAISAQVLFLNKKDVPLHIEIFRQVRSHQEVILVCKGLVLQNALNAPLDEIHGCLMRLFERNNLPFTVSEIREADEETVLLDPKVFTHVKTLKLSAQAKIDPTGASQLRIIPGFQIICIRNEPYAGATPIQFIEAQCLEFIRRARDKFPIQIDRTGGSMKFSNIYLHSFTHHALTFVLPCDYLDEESVSDIAFSQINSLLKGLGFPYRAHTLFFKRDNCFSSVYPPTKNSRYLEILGNEEALPEGLYCELSAQIMDDPVRMPGTPQIIERSAIELEILLRGINPYNRQLLTSKELIACPDLKSRIDDTVLRMLKSRIVQGIARFKAKQFEQAIHDFLSVYIYFKQSAMPHNQEYSTLLNNIACCYRDIFDYAKAIEYFNLLLLHDLKSHAPHQDKAKHLQKLADIYLKIRLPMIAKKYFNFSLKSFERDPDDDAIASIRSKLDECESLSTVIGGSFLREPQSLHSKCLEKEGQFYPEFCALIRNTHIPEGPFIFIENDYKNCDAECSVVPFTYGLEFNNTPESLREINQRYDIKARSERLLLAVIRDLQKPCLAASSRFERDAQGMVLKVNLSVILYLPSDDLDPRRVAEMLYDAFHKRRCHFMPKIGFYNATSGIEAQVFSAKVSMLFSQPNITSLQGQGIEVNSYAFTNCLQTANPVARKGLISALKSYDIALSVVSNFRDYPAQELPVMISRLKCHIRDYGEICNNDDRREMLKKLGYLYYESDHKDKAVDYCRQVIEIDQKILSANVDNLTSHVLLACDLILLGKIYKQQGNDSRAFNCFREGLAEFSRSGIEASAAVDELRKMLAGFESAAQLHACKVFSDFFKRSSARGVDKPAVSGEHPHKKNS